MRVIGFLAGGAKFGSMTQASGEDESQRKRPCRFSGEFSRPEIAEIREVLARAFERSASAAEVGAMECSRARPAKLTRSEAMAVAECMLTFVLRGSDGGQSHSQSDVASASGADRSFLRTTEEGLGADAGESGMQHGRNAQLHCLLCNDFFCQPTTLDCGHTYCAPCLESNFPAPAPSSNGGAASAENSTNGVEQAEVCLSPGCSGRLARSGLRINLTLSSILTKWFPKEAERVDCARKGRRKMAAGKFEEAAAHFSEALLFDPDNYRLLSERSVALYRSRKFRESAADAERCMKLEPSLPEGFHRQGMAYAAIGLWDDAILDFLHCARLQQAATQETVNALASVLQDYIKNSDNASALSRIQALMTNAVQSRAENSFSKQHREVEKTLEAVAPQVDDATCPLCYRLLHHPLTTPCGHVFCRSCLNRSMDHQAHCPWCRHNLEDLLANQKKETTTAVEYLMKTYLPQDYEKRHKTYIEELGLTLEGLNEPHPTISIFVCTLAVPDQPCPLHIYEPRYRLMMRRCLESGLRRFGMCLPCVNESGRSYAPVGTLLEITSVSYARDGRMLIECIGRRRFRVLECDAVDGYNTAMVEWLVDEEVPAEDRASLQQLHDETYEMARSFFQLSVFENVILRFGEMPERPKTLDRSDNGPSWVWYCVSLLPQTSQSRLDLLSKTSLRERLTILRDWFVTNNNPYAILAVVSFFQLTYFAS